MCRIQKLLHATSNQLFDALNTADTVAWRCTYESPPRKRGQVASRLILRSLRSGAFSLHLLHQEMLLWPNLTHITQHIINSVILDAPRCLFHELGHALHHLLSAAASGGSLNLRCNL